jgi:hypothetical protein
VAMVSALLPPHSPWQTFIRVFIFEGLLNIVVSGVAFVLVPTWPQNAKWVCQTPSLRGIILIIPL